MKNRGRGGVSEEEAREGEGCRGNVCEEGGGALNIFFRGRNAHQARIVMPCDPFFRMHSLAACIWQTWVRAAPVQRDFGG